VVFASGAKEVTPGQNKRKWAREANGKGARQERIMPGSESRSKSEGEREGLVWMGISRGKAQKAKKHPGGKEDGAEEEKGGGKSVARERMKGRGRDGGSAEGPMSERR